MTNLAMTTFTHKTLRCNNLFKHCWIVVELDLVTRFSQQNNLILSGEETNCGLKGQQINGDMTNSFVCC